MKINKIRRYIKLYLLTWRKFLFRARNTKCKVCCCCRVQRLSCFWKLMCSTDGAFVEQFVHHIYVIRKEYSFYFTGILWSSIARRRVHSEYVINCEQSCMNTNAMGSSKPFEFNRIFLNSFLFEKFVKLKSRLCIISHNNV